MGENEEEKNIQAGQLFENFVQASTCKGTLQSFNILCRHLELDTQDYRNFYTNLKSKVCTWKAKGLWSKLDKRASHKEYKRGKACLQTKCLIIGGGPCGLRTAIELSLLGAKVVVIEKRDSFSRNNVLHLWPYTIHDLRALGAKKFYGKFCAGSIDHISIRQLQLMLLKVALILGVEIHVNVEFVKLLEPPEDQENERISWRAEVNPVDHYVSKFDFDIIIGADGRRSTLDGFRRKEFRGKLAIAITANFINRNTTAEAKVEEISGVAFIFNQKFFQDLKEETGIDLENIVYYKDNTHYFVMTAKKQSLLDKGVILNDYIDTEVLLSSDNVDQEALQSYAREAADFATNYQLPTLDFAINHYGQPDVDMFDFTCMYASENAALVRERQGHKLIVALVGDSLLEPFWPMGTGCARGFLAAFDTAWMVRNWSQGVSPLELLAERESIYRLLPQTTPENISKNFDQYTLDPGTRYPNLNSNCVRPHQVRHLYVTDELQNCTIERSSSLKRSVRVKRHESDIRPNKLLTWCQQQTEGYKNVSVTNLTTSWKSGLALCALIHHFKPELIDFDSLNEEAVAKNNQLAFDIAEQELGIPPITTGKEMASVEEPDKLSMVMYLSKFYMLFRAMPLTSADIYIRENGDRNEPKRSHSLPSNYQNLTLPRKRIPKENKTTEDDALSKRRRKGFATADEPTSFSNQSASSGSECGETKEVINQNKVKSMATQLLAKFEENAPISSVRRQASLRKEFPQNFGGSDICYFCKKRVYVMERLSAEGQFFHRECFRCEFCGTTLRLGIYAFDADEGKFYCKPHFAYCKTSNKQRKRRQELEMETKADGSMQEEEPKHSKMNTEDISEAANSMTERHPDSPLQKCDEPTQPKKSKNDLYSSSCEGQSSVISEWTTVRVIPEEEMAEHNLLAVRVMINSDETSSESESEPQGKLLSSQKFAPVTASPFNPAKNSDYLRRHASLNNSSVNREESSIRSKAADALQRAHSFHSTTYERYQSWRSKFKMTLPVFARKGPELSSTEKPSSSHAFQECSSEPQESLTVYQREQSKFHIPKFIKQNVKLQESSVPAYIPHGKDITTVQNINHKDNVQTNLLESSVEYRGKTASIYGQEGKYLSSADEYTQSSETATQKHTSQDPFIVGKKDYNTIQDEPKNNQGLLSMKKAAYLSFQKPKFHWQHEPLGNGHRNKIHVKKTSSESAIIKGSIDRETEKPSDSSALPMSNRKASPPLSEGQNGLSVPLKDKNSTVGGTDDAPLSPLKLLANAVRRSFTSWSSSSSSPEQSRKANKVSDSSFSRDTENIDLDVEDGTDVSHMGQTRKYSENKDSAANHNSALEKDKDISSIDEITENSFLDSSPPDKASGDTTKYVYGTCQNNKLEDVVQKLLEKISLKDRNPVTNNTDFGSTQFSVSSHSSKDDYISSSDESGRKSATKLKMDRYPRKKKRHTTAKYKEKQEELQRLHRAQTIQRQLQELEEKQQTLEEKGVKLEKMLRGESECSSEDENRTLQEWFKLVVEKNKVDRYVSELLICAQELELEDQQRRLQQEWREKIIIDDSEKTQDELNEEKERLIKILQIVEKRDKLVSVLEQQRLKENQEDRDFKEFVLSTGYQFKNN
ncbi:F-actin-monooxygenase MICAL2-like isoform X9 [Protopterus annectens]|uniref:F-actin-monooxygenase MICAL2-like isoform X9 n=1 Tax=Protopterus annectens TaxID=7888 RepID=UPI001CFB4ADC|nr:F-actin-monooxygenase MICAL2-like isoform X9 [Protopterus annectens]